MNNPQNMNSEQEMPEDEMQQPSAENQEPKVMPQVSMSDPLLCALKTLGKLHAVSLNADSAIAGLALQDGKLTPKLFVRAAERSGFKAAIVKRSWRQIHEAVLPVVLLGEGDEVLLLTKKGKKESEVFFSQVGDASETVANSEIKKMYSGYAIMVKPEHKFEARSEIKMEKRSKNWFWGTLWGFRGFYARVALASVVINTLALASSLFVMNVYDRVVPNQAHETLFVLGAGALLAYVLEFCLKSLRTFMVDRAGHRADLIMGSKLFEQMMAMKFSARPDSGGTLASQARAYEGLREFFTSATLATLVDLPFVFLFAFVVFCLGGPAAIPMVAGAFLVMMIAMCVQIPMGKAVKQSYQATNQRHAMVIESLNALETVKATRGESVLQKRMEDCINTCAKADGKSRWYSQAAINSTALINHLVSIAIVFVAFYQVLGGSMTMGAMIACVILSQRGMAPLNALASLLSRLQQSRRSLKGLNDIMKMPREEEDEEKKISITDFSPTIATTGLKFSYPSAETIDVLSDVNITIEKGEKVGLLGRNGSGKTTLMKLLLSLYEPTEGRIDVSGFDIRQVTPVDLRKNIAYMPQDNQLLYGTLRENITVGHPWTEDEDIWRALSIAGVAEFVRSHPEGLDMHISEGGCSLSGGQRQAVCLARALMGTPELLLFDEPTAAMDHATETQLIGNIKNYVEQSESTLILSTHKSGLLKLVDRVIILEKGKVIADGPRDQVIKGSKPVTSAAPKLPQAHQRENQPAQEGQPRNASQLSG